MPRSALGETAGLNALNLTMGSIAKLGKKKRKKTWRLARYTAHALLLTHERRVGSFQVEDPEKLREEIPDELLNDYLLSERAPRRWGSKSTLSREPSRSQGVDKAIAVSGLMAYSVGA